MPSRDARLALILQSRCTRMQSNGFEAKGSLAKCIVHSMLQSPGLGELQLRLEGCGVGDVSGYEEAWGRVSEVGAGVRGFEVGDRVKVYLRQVYSEYAVVRADFAKRLPSEWAWRLFPGTHAYPLHRLDEALAAAARPHSEPFRAWIRYR